MKMFTRILLSAFILIGINTLFAQDIKNGDIILTDWQLKSTVLERTNGDVISSGSFTQDKWYPVQVPTTVLNALVKNKVYPDPRMDMNNYLIPDISDEFNAKHDLAKYSYLPNKENPWKDPYWFRTEFRIPADQKGKQVWLNFNGINYRAEVWLNGKKVADSENMVGMFLRYKFNVTGMVKNDEANYLAVKIYPVDHPGVPGTQFVPNGMNRSLADDLFKDLTLKISGGWDCAMPVRDRNTGIHQEVYLSFTGDVDIINPSVVTELPLPDTTSANLSICATLFNTSGKTQKGIIKGKINLLNEVDMLTYVKKFNGSMNSITFEKEVEVPANDTITVTLTYKDFPQLTVKNPHLWWPLGYGEQYLHNLKLSFELGGTVSAEKNTTFGIRTVQSTLKEINGDFGRVFYINGKRVFCKGGWIQPDMLLDMSKKRLYDEARLMAGANMNLVSTEDMPTPPDDLLDACDKYGIMWWNVFYQCYVIVPGTKDAYNPLDHFLAIKCTNDIILRYRNHPSLVAWVGANESLPGPDLFFALKDQLKRLDQTRTFLASTAIWWDWEKLSPYVKDDFPVGTTDNNVPDYTWYPLPFYFDEIDTAKDQMFRNELGAPAVPGLASLKKFIFSAGQDKNNPLFPLDSIWAEHGAWDGFGYAYKAYDDAIKNYYGFKTKNIADYVRIAQIVNSDSYRAMFEAANSRMWDITSGVMIWKINSSAPDVVWSIYDWFLSPHAGYYYTKKACEPLHIQMNANDYQVSVINAQHRQLNNLTVSAKVYDFDMNVKWEREMKINLQDDRYLETFKVPAIKDISPVYFVKLELKNESGEILSENLYWESSKSTLDFSELSALPYEKPDLTYKTEETNDEYHIKVKLKNTTGKLSFMSRLAVVRADSEEVLPTFWDDNYITLLPGEEKIVEAKFAKKDLNGLAFSVIVDNDR